ncbi:hypothetical protein FO519_005349 [Halicephalobus sp. NKZ332]|nr:hypothetical protein FO519_005349 [Halicephalobus sp. NKZ332]
MDENNRFLRENRTFGKGDKSDPDDAEISLVMEKSQRRTAKEFFVKYFLHGQQLTDDENQNSITSNEVSFDFVLLQKYRKFFAFLIPFVIAQFVWWSLALRFEFLPLYETHWQMPVTMIGGAIVAGMTAEGGGAIAFPVMTFILHTTPKTARDFSLMIQATGMSMAFFAIFFMRIQVEWRAILYGLSGAIPGLIIGFKTLDQVLAAPEKKMLFVSIWSAFAIALYILNREKKRQTVTVIQNFSPSKAATLILTGFIGGIFTSFAGSGLDICVFSMITLLFRVSEKTATPSTVIAMALLSQFAVFWRVVIDYDIDPIAVDYLKVSAPIVVFFAPFGSFIGSHFHRLTLAWLVCLLEIAAFVGFLATRPTVILLGTSVGILIVGFVFFYFLSRAGKKLMGKEQEKTIIDLKVIQN